MIAVGRQLHAQTTDRDGQVVISGVRDCRRNHAGGAESMGDVLVGYRRVPAELLAQPDEDDP